MANRNTPARSDLMAEARIHQELIFADVEVANFVAEEIERSVADPFFCCMDCEFGNAPYEADNRLANLELMLHTLGV